MAATPISLTLMNIVKNVPPPSGVSTYRYTHLLSSLAIKSQVAAYLCNFVDSDISSFISTYVQRYLHFLLSFRVDYIRLHLWNVCNTCYKLLHVGSAKLITSFGHNNKEMYFEGHEHGKYVAIIWLEFLLCHIITLVLFALTVQAFSQ